MCPTEYISSGVGTAIVNTGIAPNVLTLVNISGQAFHFFKVKISIVKIG